MFGSEVCMNVNFNVKVNQGFSGVFRHGFFRIFDYKFLRGYSQEVCIEGFPHVFVLDVLLIFTVFFFVFFFPHGF